MNVQQQTKTWLNYGISIQQTMMQYWNLNKMRKLLQIKFQRQELTGHLPISSISATLIFGSFFCFLPVLVSKQLQLLSSPRVLKPSSQRPTSFIRCVGSWAWGTRQRASKTQDSTFISNIYEGRIEAFVWKNDSVF